MTLIEQKLIEAYAVLVMANRYILRETDRTNEAQKLVPEKFVADVEIKVAERTIEVLNGQAQRKISLI